MTTSTLFSEFPNISKEDWKQKVIKDLRGADFDEKLRWQIDENMTVEPLYDASDTEKLAYLQHYLTGKSEADVVGMSPRAWRNCQQVTIEAGEEKSANARALLALQNDANEIIFAPENVEKLNLEILLKQIQVEFCAISWEVSDEEALFLVDKYVTFLETQNVDLAKVKGFLKTPSTQNVSILIHKTINLPQFRAITLAVETSKNMTDELAQLAKNTVELLESDLGVDLILNNLVFHSNAQTNYFEEIAKLRALRFLITEIAQRYAEDYTADKVYILSSTSVEANADDPYQNMLSNTTQAMSALIGGCNSLWVVPHNQKINQKMEEVSAFSERIARNVSNLLREESYFGTVIDPAAGSYYIETLTDKLMETAWNKFTKI